MEEQVELITAREKEVVAQKEVENKHDAKSTKWKLLALEQSVKAVLFISITKKPR